MPAERILIVRGDGIGDALMLAPLVAALRDAGHALGAVLSTHNAQIYAQEVFERVHVLERIPWPRHGSTRDSFAQALAGARNARYDVALIASEEPEAYKFARETGVLRRVGFTNGWEKPFKGLWTRGQLTRALRRPASAGRVREHEVETMFALGAGLHGEPAPTRDVARLRPLLLSDAPISDDRVVVQASSKYGERGLGADAFMAIVRALADEGRRVAVVGGPADEEFAGVIARKAGAEHEIPASLAVWKRSIAAARALVTLDSGAAHVAGMLGVPCVDLFAADRNVAADVRRWAPWAAPYRALVVTNPPQASLPADIAAAVADLGAEGGAS
jgi:ADP-heptose:LPS heptosyltransferase